MTRLRIWVKQQVKGAELGGNKDDGGFAYVDAVVAVFILAGFALFAFSILGNAGEADYQTKELRVTRDLVEPYLDYYQNVDVNRSNVDDFIGIQSEVDLVSLASREEVSEDVRRRLRLNCKTEGQLVDGNYVKFLIECDRNGDGLNRGNPYVIYKFINE